MRLYMEDVVTNVVECARCGLNHAAVTFQPSLYPIPFSDGEYTHWATCPENREPILLRVSGDGA